MATAAMAPVILTHTPRPATATLVMCAPKETRPNRLFPAGPYGQGAYGYGYPAAAGAYGYPSAAASAYGYPAASYGAPYGYGFPGGFPGRAARPF